MIQDRSGKVGPRPAIEAPALVVAVDGQDFSAVLHKKPAIAFRHMETIKFQA